MMWLLVYLPFLTLAVFAVFGIFGALLIALLAFVFWTAPQQFFGFSPRLVGFNLDTFAVHWRGG